MLLRYAITSILLILASDPLLAKSKGFADKPGGGKNDPRIEVWFSIAPNQGVVLAPGDKDAGDVCGNYTLDAPSGDMIHADVPPSMPPNNSGANQFLAIRFPFKINSEKAKKSLLSPKDIHAATSFLRKESMTITDEFGSHVPGIATIEAKDAFGTKMKNDPSFPAWYNASFENRLIDKRVLTYVADHGDQNLSTISAFTAPGPGLATSTEIRVRINKVAGIVINGFWVVNIDQGGSLPQPPLTIQSVTPTKGLSTIVDGNLAVSPGTDFILDLSAPVTPMSVGVSKSWVKDWNKSNGGPNAKFHHNLGLFPHPEDDSPIYPNLVLLAKAGTAEETAIPFDVGLVTPNNLAQYRIRPKGKLPKGVFELQAIPFASNSNPNPAGGLVNSAFTTLYNKPLEIDVALSTVIFHVGK